MRKILALAVSAAAIFGPGLALAEEALVAIPLSETGQANDIYVTDGPGLWEETNGCEGLQTAPVDCKGDDELEPPDNNLLSDAPEVPEAPEVPAP